MAEDVFTGGKNISYIITPMTGLVFGEEFNAFHLRLMQQRTTDV